MIIDCCLKFMVLMESFKFNS
uniref:Uncharacterized protein n=1 Tax=Rhizophora mucronata TaxID=61149 RepID=A0A2P2QIT0_RHIMU